MSWIPAAIGAAGAIGGALLGSNKDKSQTQTTTTDPWKVQQPYLEAGFGSAADLYDKYYNQKYYQGDLYANLTPAQQAALYGTQGFAGGQAMDLAQGFVGNAQPFLNQGQNFIDQANRLANFNPGDPTQSNISSAGQYADNPYLNGAIDAASRDVTRNLTEDVLPGINRGAAAGGNTNSTRTGIAEGIALRGAQDRIGDIAATVRGDAWNQGLGLSEQARQSNMGAQLQGMGQGTGYLNTAYGRGMDTSNQGIQQIYNNYANMMQAGQGFQQDQQGDINAAFQRWQGQYDLPWDALSKYMGTVGGANYGSNTVQKVPTGAAGGWQGALQGAVGGAATLGGLYKDITGMSNASAGNQQYQGLY